MYLIENKMSSLSGCPQKIVVNILEEIVNQGTRLSSMVSVALRGVLEVLQHPGPQFWGPAIGGSCNLVIGL